MTAEGSASFELDCGFSSVECATGAEGVVSGSSTTAAALESDSACPLPFVLFVIYSTFGDIFLTFHFFSRRQLRTREESRHFVPNLFQCKVCSQSKNMCFENIPHGTLGKSGVTWQSQNQNGVQML